jgi:hypothetical protein
MYLADNYYFALLVKFSEECLELPRARTRYLDAFRCKALLFSGM